jgi:hypothetical protein
MNWGSWKTTAAGVMPLIGAVYHLASMATGTAPPDGTSIMMDLSVLSTGIGLMFAKDHNVSNSPVPVPAKAVDPATLPPPAPQRFGGAG